MPSQPSENLRAARRALEDLPGYALLTDWAWYSDLERWVLSFEFHQESDSPLIPAISSWWVLAEDQYPFGTIKLYPSKSKSITATFPHQLWNGIGSTNLPWREGEVCVATGLRPLGRLGRDDEPVDSETRLRWNCERLAHWLLEAAQGHLVQADDPFELPHFPYVSGPKVAFCENPEGLSTLLSLSNSYGLVEFSLHPQSGALVVQRFLSTKGTELLRIRWGTNLERLEITERGAWLRCPRVPILEPWQAPSTWGELRAALEAQGVHLDEVMRPLSARLRDGKPHTLLIGFPIPERVSQSDREYSWQPLRLPVLSNGVHVLSGFRANETGYLHRDRTLLFRPDTLIEWGHGENWDQEQVSTRGRLSLRLRELKVLLIGGGALGSAIGEMLTRAGVTSMTIIDGQRLAIGNLVRHTLTADDLSKYKATALATRLNAVSPHSHIDAVNGAVETIAPELLSNHDLIIDCTGEDEVLRHLAATPNSGSKLFTSFSVGIKARRLFCFFADSSTLPVETFQELIMPWLAKERLEYDGYEFPREGTGCWSAVFPARSDDIWLMACSAVKALQDLISQPTSLPQLLVFEQVYDESGYVGVQRATTIDAAAS